MSDIDAQTLKLLESERDRLEPGRYQTLTEHETDEAWHLGFNHAIRLLKESSLFTLANTGEIMTETEAINKPELLLNLCVAHAGGRMRIPKHLLRRYSSSSRLIRYIDDGTDLVIESGLAEEFGTNPFRPQLISVGKESTECPDPNLRLLLCILPLVTEARAFMKTGDVARCEQALDKARQQIELFCLPAVIFAGKAEQP